MRVVLLICILVAFASASLNWGTNYYQTGYGGNNQYAVGSRGNYYHQSGIGYHPKYIESPFYKPDYYSREHRRRYDDYSSSESDSDSLEIEIIVPNPVPPTNPC